MAPFLDTVKASPTYDPTRLYTLLIVDHRSPFVPDLP